MRLAASSALYRPLDTILGTPGLVRVTRVLASHGGSFDVAQIARRTGLSLPSVRYALRRLVALELITVAGAGRTMVVSLRTEHPLAPVLVSLFEAELRQAVDLREAILQAAMRVGNISTIWMYGSAARGTDSPGSDIDLALISSGDNPAGDRDAFRDALADIAPQLSRRISTIALSPHDLRSMAERRTPFWRELERDAVVVDGDSPAVYAPRARMSVGRR